MANQEQVKILKQGVDVWNRWREREENLGLDKIKDEGLREVVKASRIHHRRPDLKEADLSEAELQGANLKNVDLIGANLTGANFRNSVLRGANLSKAHLENANLDQVDLSFAKLEDANLRHTHLMGANLFSANLRRAKLLNANLNSVAMTDAFLNHAVLSDAYLPYAQLLRSDFRSADLDGCDIYRGNLFRANFQGANLKGAGLAGANLEETKFIGADLQEARLVRAYLQNANLKNANLKKTSFFEADLRNADLSETNLVDANLIGANLVRTKIDKARISGSWIYSINVWDVVGEPAEQKDLIITAENAPKITVDNIKVAQFIYLILNNEEIRDVINVLTSKTVLILGRFSIPERKSILDALRKRLREFDLLPIVFDFERPVDKDFTETIKTLAGLSYFVIADVTNPKSSPLELQATVPDYKIPFVPIIHEGENPFAMMIDLQKKYDWVLNTVTYDSMETLIKVLKPLIIDPAMKKRQELRIIKAQEPEVISGRDFLKKRKKGKK